MALNNLGDIMTESLVRNNRTTTDGFIQDTTIQGWTKDAHTWAAGYKKWPFTEGRQSTTFAAVEEWSFEGYRSDSFRLVQVGGFALKKLNFEDYQKFRELEPNSQDRVYTDYARILFINPKIDVSGTLTVYGQLQPNIDVTDFTAKTVFSDFDEDANEAVVEKITAYLKRREHLVDEAEIHDKRAETKLDQLWQKILDEQYKYQTHPDTGGMFERFDILRGRATDELSNENQFQ